jgi:hypothetical protein
LLDENRVRQAVQPAHRPQAPRLHRPLLSQFQRLVQLDVARHTARIESAADLSPSIQAQARADLERAYGAA